MSKKPTKQTLKTYRVLAGYTQLELATYAKVSLTTIKQLEKNADKIISVRTARQLIAALNDGLQTMQISTRINVYDVEWNIEGLPSGLLKQSSILNNKVSQGTQANTNK